MADASETRQRFTASPKTEAKPIASAASAPARRQRQEHQRIGVVDVLRVLAGGLLLSSVLSYFVTGDSYAWGLARPAWTRKDVLLSRLRGPLSLTEAELLRYDGTDAALPIYVAINGSVYDVSASPHFYGPGGGYHVFAGRDATRALVTGCFEADATPDLRGAEEVFMPLDLDAAPRPAEGATEAERGAARAAWKARRQRAGRVARAKVRATVAQWQAMFERGGPAGRYFRVGTVRMEGGPGPLRVLCKGAQDRRPRTSEGLEGEEDEEEGEVEVEDPRRGGRKG